MAKIRTQSSEVGKAKASGKSVDDVLSDLKKLSDELKLAEEQYGKTQVELDDFLAFIPNIPNDSVPEGKSEEEIRKTWEPGLSNYKEMRKKYLLYP